jgi:hypothetical protein
MTCTGQRNRARAFIFSWVSTFLSLPFEQLLQVLFPPRHLHPSLILLLLRSKLIVIVVLHEARIFLLVRQPFKVKRLTRLLHQAALFLRIPCLPHKMLSSDQLHITQTLKDECTPNSGSRVYPKLWKPSVP